jgi:hypothetical protein
MTILSFSYPDIALRSICGPSAQFFYVMALLLYVECFLGFW